MPKKLTKEGFIEKARNIHGNKYDYSKVEYISNKSKVCIICPKHGEFWQVPSNHLKGCGCPLCVNNNIKLTTESFIESATKIYGDKYDYSKVEYINAKTKICIICTEHGEFWQIPYSHISGRGCPICGRQRIWETRVKITTNEIIAKAKKIHGNKYDYSKVKYTDAHEKFCIICPIHGEFKQMPYSHLKGANCPKCVGGVKISQKEFITKSKKVHNNKYDYSKVEYINSDTKVCIVCPEHGVFWQTPYHHTAGHGCPKCKSSNLENNFTNFLLSNGFTESIDNNILTKNTFIRQKKFDWLKYRGKLSLDFYLPDYNIAIECQGEQHFKPVKCFGGEKRFNIIQQRDSIKKKLCELHGIKIFYYSDLGIEYPYTVYEDLEELLNEIKSK